MVNLGPSLYMFIFLRNSIKSPLTILVRAKVSYLHNIVFAVTIVNITKFTQACY